MTDDEAAERIDRVRPANGDPEEAHTKGDSILIEVLLELGYSKTVAAWESLPKWYS